MSKPDLQTVALTPGATGPRSLPDGRIVTVDAPAKDVDVNDPFVASLINDGHIGVVEHKPRGRKAATSQSKEASS